MRLWTGVRGQFRPLLALALPLAAGELGWTTMSVVDTMMVGRLSTEAIGAVSIGGMLFYAVAVPGMGLLFGLDTIVSQAFGAGRIADCHRGLRDGLWICVPSVPLLMAVQWIWTLLLDEFGVQESVRVETIPYIKALMWSTPALMIYTAYRRYLAGMDLVKPIMFALISANAVNAVANWMFVFGNLGVPAFGTQGAGWATCASRIYMAAALAGYALWKHPGAMGGIGWLPDWRRIGGLVRLGLPAAAQMGFEVSVFALGTTLIGRLEPRFLAAHQIALQAVTYTYMVPYAIGSAVAVRVGQAIGRRDGVAAGNAGWAALLLGAGFMTAAGLTFVLIPRLLARAFTTEPVVIETAVGLLAVAALFQLFDGLQAVATGALRGAGDTQTAAWAHLICYWAIGLPAGYYLCFTAAWGAVGIWSGFCLALILIGTILTAAWLRQTRRLHPLPR